MTLTPEEQQEAIRRLIAINRAVNGIIEFTEDAASMAKQADASGLAFSLLMLREAISAYGVEMNKWVKELISS